MPRVVEQIDGLEYAREQVRVVVVEGDSVDETASLVEMWAEQDARVTVVSCETGGPKYPSVVDARRFAQLARVFNTGLDAVDLTWSEWVLFTPVDVRFEADVLRRLMAHGKDLMAPFFFRPDGVFYDIWGYSRQGRDFEMFEQGETLRRYGEAPIAMATVGGMVLMRAAVVAAGCRYAVEDVDRGLCRAALALGFEVYADPMTQIWHEG